MKSTVVPLNILNKCLEIAWIARKAKDRDVTATVNRWFSNRTGNVIRRRERARKGLNATFVANLPLRHWSSQLFDLRAPSSTDVPVLLLNQPQQVRRVLWLTKSCVCKGVCSNDVTIFCGSRAIYPQSLRSLSSRFSLSSKTDPPIPLVLLLYKKVMRRREGAYSIRAFVWYYGQWLSAYSGTGAY